MIVNNRIDAALPRVFHQPIKAMESVIAPRPILVQKRVIAECQPHRVHPQRLDIIQVARADPRVLVRRDQILGSHRPEALRQQPAYFEVVPIVARVGIAQYL